MTEDGAAAVNVVMSGIGAVACLAFMATYHLLARWWRSSEGRNLMGLPAAIAGFLGYTVGIWAWPAGWPAVVLRGVRVVMTVAIVVLMVQRTVMVVRAQRR